MLKHHLYKQCPIIIRKYFAHSRYVMQTYFKLLNHIYTKHLWCISFTSENIIHKGVANCDAGAIWISGDFYIRENSKTRQRAVSHSTDHSRLSASLLPTLVLQSTRLNRTNVGVPARHVCKGASYSLDANSPSLPPSVVPFLLSAREIRYEFYLCIFENLPRMPLAKVCWAFLTFPRIRFVCSSWHSAYLILIRLCNKSVRGIEFLLSKLGL